MLPSLTLSLAQYAALGFLVVLSAAGCQGGVEAVHVPQSASENGMIDVAQKWTIATDQLPSGDVAIDDDGSVWVAQSSGELLHLLSSGEQKSQRIFVGSVPARVVSISRASGDRFLLIVDVTYGQTFQAAQWKRGTAEAELISLAREPRLLAWVDQLQSIWFLAEDNGLYSYSNGITERVGNDRYNALVVTSDGRRVAVRQSGTDDVFVSSTSPVAWTLLRRNVGGDIAGFGPNDRLVVLNLGVWEKNALPPENRLLTLDFSGSEREIARGTILKARSRGHQIVTFRQSAPDRLIAEMRQL